MCLFLLLREKVKKKRRGKRWWTSLQEQCPRSPEILSYLKSTYKFIQLLAAGQCELIRKMFCFQISGVIAGRACCAAWVLVDRSQQGALAVWKPAWVGVFLSHWSLVTAVWGGCGVGQALPWTVCLVLLLSCQGGAQHSGVPLGHSVTCVHCCWATQGCPAAVLVSPFCSALWCPNISLFLSSPGSLLLLPRCTCTAGKRRKESDPSVGKVHLRKSRNPAWGEPLRLSDGDWRAKWAATKINAEPGAQSCSWDCFQQLGCCSLWSLCNDQGHCLLGSLTPVQPYSPAVCWPQALDTAFILQWSPMKYLGATESLKSSVGGQILCMA